MEAILVALYAVQLGLVVFSFFVGRRIARRLEQTPGLGQHRRRTALAFGGGLAAQVACWTLFALAVPGAGTLPWLLMAIGLAIYLPCLLVIARAEDVSESPQTPVP